MPAPNHPSEISKVRFDFTADEIKAAIPTTLNKLKKVEEEISQLPLEEVTAANTLMKIEELSQDPTQTCIEFLQHVSSDAEVRQASVEFDKEVSAYYVKFEMNVEVYKRIKQCQTNKAIYDGLDKEAKRMVDHQCRDYERLGLDKNEETRNAIQEISTELSALSIEFAKNLGEENTILLFNKEELEGMPIDFVESLKKSESEPGKLEVTLKYPHVLPIQNKCAVPSTRAAVEKAFNQRCKGQNDIILEKMAVLRAKAAKLRGYNTHADYILEVRMAKTSSAVRDFLNELNTKLEPIAELERNELLELKKKECEEKGLEFSGGLEMSDFRYYLQKREERLFNVNQEEIKEYFPVQVVVDGMFKIYQDLLGLKIEEVTGANTWHEDVKMYRVLNNVEGGDGIGALMGFFYLDLHPRPNKYGHAACFTMQSASFGDERTYPVAALVCNFPKPEEGKPKSGLLPHTQAVTAVHEAGHGFHVICSRAKYIRFSGTHVERDFVECPSQMLENWAWSQKSLELISGHYETGKPMPDDLANRLAAARDANAGLLNKRQLLFALFDQELHSKSPEEAENIKTGEILERLNQEVLGIPMTQDTNFSASFGHLAGGYDAQYYGYLWSQVFATDMFATRFEGENLLNPEVGLAYRRSILEPGGSRDAIEHLREFLGRDPNQKAFLKSKGLVVEE